MEGFDKLTDKEIVNGIIHNNPEIIEYFFFEKCSDLLLYIVDSVFGGKIDKREVLNELFSYLVTDNWKKLRSFNFQSTLLTWLSVVSIRFFIKKRDSLIENESSEALIKESRPEFISQFSCIDRLNLELALNKMPNPRYRKAIILLDMQDKEYEEVAVELGVNVSNLYNLHRRALAQLKVILTN